MSIICGFPTNMKDTTLAVTSCRLEAVDDDDVARSVSFIPVVSNSIKESS